MKTEIFESRKAFINRKNKDTNGVSKAFAISNPNYKEMNNSNTGCWNCFDCTDCDSCSNCTDCDSCSNCKKCKACIACYNCIGCYTLTNYKRIG